MVGRQAMKVPIARIDWLLYVDFCHASIMFVTIIPHNAIAL